MMSEVLAIGNILKGNFFCFNEDIIYPLDIFTISLLLNKEVILRS